MGIRLIGLAPLLVACSAAEPAASGEDHSPVTHSAQMGGVSIELVVLGRSCALRLGEQIVQLALPPPCRFVGYSDASPVSHDYEEVGTVALVAGPLAAEADYNSVDDRVAADGCSHIAQPIFISNGAIEVGEPKIGLLAFCSRSPPDEKYYYSLAFPPD